MSKQHTFRYILSALLWWGILNTAPSATARPRYWPTGLQLGIEAVNSLYYKYYQEQIGQKYELNTCVDFARLLVEGDYGWGNMAPSRAEAYEKNGQYFRVGLNYNLAPDTTDRNTAFLGVRYAQSFLHPTNNRVMQGSIPTASWYEVVVGMKVKIWTIFYLGGTVQYKFGISADRALESQHLLGWGSYKPGDDEALGITYYISLRIPFERHEVFQNNSPKE